MPLKNTPFADPSSRNRLFGVPRFTDGVRRVTDGVRRVTDGVPRCTASATALILVLVVSGIIAGCGRSGPETAAPVTDGTEPAVAGIQVVSDEPVITPQPTTAPPSTTATSVAAPGPGGSYVVEPGDTLSVIAQQFGVSVDALSQANGITDVNTIKPGQELIIPG